MVRGMAGLRMLASCHFSIKNDLGSPFFNLTCFLHILLVDSIQTTIFLVDS